MTCSEFERQIILFSELTIEEKVIVNNHVSQCESCAAFLESQSSMTNVIRKVASIKPEPKDQFVLTRNILAKIKTEDQGRLKIFDFSTVSVPYNFARYAMAAVSVGLIIFLSAELLTPIQFENNTRQGTAE